MAQKTCPVCAGSRGRSQTRTVNDPGGTYHTVNEFVNCSMCGGSGRVWAPDPAPSQGNLASGSSKSHSSGAKATPDTRTPEEKNREFEDGIAGVFMLATWGAFAWAASIRSLGPWYVPTVLALCSGAIVRWMLMNPLRFILVWLRRIVVIAFIVALILGGLYVVSRMAADKKTSQPNQTIQKSAE